MRKAIVSTLAFVAATACLPPDIPTTTDDNTACSFEGYEEVSVAGHLRIGFDFEGGTVRVTEGGLPRDLLCRITSRF